jgi:Zn-dependent protease with chaperone function
MKRRGLLAAVAAGCAHCTAVAQGSAWLAPPRFAKPDLASDEGGLWAMMDREETRLRRSPFMLRDAPLRDYLQDIACKLGGDHCADVRVYPVRTPFFNASMAPNGMMQIWSGLLLRVDNEAQLAAVIGHEIGHYMQRHTLDRLRDAKARSAFGMFMGMFGLVGLIGQMAALAGAFGFSRDQEREADQIGLQLMRQAGYDTREASKVWEQLRAETVAAHDSARSNPMFATHPPSDERSATLARLAAADGDGFLGSTELSSRLASLQSMMLEDELRRGQYGETLVLLDRLIARAPQRSDLFYFRGEARRQRAKDDDVDQALQDFQRALDLGQEPPQLHRSLGYLHQGRDRVEAAKQAFGRYIELAPQAADAALIKSFL